MGYFWHNEGFLHDSIHKHIPDEAIQVSDERYAALMAAQSSGFLIVSGEDGLPMALAPDPEQARLDELKARLGNDYVQRDDGGFYKIRYTKKDFLLRCGLPQVVALNRIIAEGNALAKTVHDLLFASDYIDVTDPATIEMVGLLTTEAAGPVLTEARAAEILHGEPYVIEDEDED